MIISRKTILLAGILLLAASGLSAQQKVRQTREEYVERYKALAIDQMERYGIPASITMAQGILESDSGNSTLALKSNNHFGIKCKSDWTGQRVYHDDDAKGECFRSYPTVEASYHDHAEFLDTSPRYDSLFTYSSTDYKGWARGLKAAGYATAPDYAQRLVRIIEELQLYLLDQPNGSRLYAARQTVGADASSLQTGVASGGGIDPDHYQVSIQTLNGYNVYTVNEVHYVLAKPGDTYESLGKQFRISAKNLRKFNDVTLKKAQPAAGQPVYLERKQKRWRGDLLIHTCQAGETILSVSQRYGIRARSLEKLNKAQVGRTLPAGVELRLK